MPRIELERLLKEALAWKGTDYEPTEFQEDNSPTSTPTFGVGNRRFLLSNLIRLVLSFDPNFTKALDVSGAHLPFVDLKELVANSSRELILREANLEGSTFASSINVLTDRALRSQGTAASYEDLKEYCIANGLLRPSRFWDYSNDDEFVIVPGGHYRVAAHSPKSNGEHAEEIHDVEIAGFLIQKYPVTNRQFRNFLAKYPLWSRESFRGYLANDWYLNYWPLNPKHSVLDDEEWLDRPVVAIPWTVAWAFATLSGLRLPTEVEWEVAARIGEPNRDGELWPAPWADPKRKEPTYLYQGEVTTWCQVDLDTDTAESDEVSEVLAVPTQSVFKLPKGFETWCADRSSIDEVPRHMLGLVRHMVLDTWDEKFPCLLRHLGNRQPVNLGLKYNEAVDDWRPARAKEAEIRRVVRGSSYASGASRIRVDFRTSQPSANVNSDQGFRCVRPIWVPRDK